MNQLTKKYVILGFVFAFLINQGLYLLLRNTTSLYFLFIVLTLIYSIWFWLWSQTLKINDFTKIKKETKKYLDFLWFIPSFLICIVFFYGFKDELLKIGGLSPYLYSIDCFIVIVILCPVYEEIMFRRFLLRWCSLRMKLANAILLSSIIFALFHLPAVPVFEFFGGVIFSLLYIWRKNIIAPIALHLGANLALAVIEMLMFYKYV